MTLDLKRQVEFLRDEARAQRTATGLGMPYLIHEGYLDTRWKTPEALEAMADAIERDGKIPEEWPS